MMRIVSDTHDGIGVRRVEVEIHDSDLIDYSAGATRAGIVGFVERRLGLRESEPWPMMAKCHVARNVRTYVFWIDQSEGDWLRWHVARAMAEALA